VLLKVVVEGLLILADQLVAPGMTFVANHLGAAETHHLHLEAFQRVAIDRRRLGVVHIEFQHFDGGAG
jgi:hypothetical protein